MAVGLLALLAAACSDDGGESSLTATLLVHGGTVEVQASGSTSFAPPRDGQVLSEGAEVRTGLDGRASIEWPDGSVTRLDFGTSFRIAAFERGSGVIASTVIEGEQATGNSYSRVTEITETGSRFVIETPTASAAVQGTTYAVLVNPDGSTSIVVTEGAVVVTSSSGEEVLSRLDQWRRSRPTGPWLARCRRPMEFSPATGSCSTTIATTRENAVLKFGPGAMTAIEVTPAESAINLGESQVYAAQGVDSTGSTIGGVTATFDLDGVPCDGAVCTPEASGEYTVTATFEEFSATASLVRAHYRRRSGDSRLGQLRRPRPGGDRSGRRDHRLAEHFVRFGGIPRP
jgi:hypothetical protein